METSRARVPLCTAPPGALPPFWPGLRLRGTQSEASLNGLLACLLLLQWKANAPTLTRLAVGQTLMINQLIDMEWKFGGNRATAQTEWVGKAGSSSRLSTTFSPGLANRLSPFSSF